MNDLARVTITYKLHYTGYEKGWSNIRRVGLRMGNRSNSLEWSGGHPALDLVNTVDERPCDAPIENLATYGDLVRFAELAGLIERPLATTLRDRTGPVGARVARRARELREHLYKVLTAVHEARPIPQIDLNAIGAAIRAAHAARLLVRSSSTTLVGHRWAPSSGVEAPLHACALAIERLLSETDRNRIRKCGARDCEVYFIDISKGQRRRWCRMKNCGNREKQRRWRSDAD
jgi:predicted RNA-binding Zn ribbon-like protein